MATELKKREKTEVEKTSAEQLIQSGPAYSPDVDIYGNDDGVVFSVDLPGVKKGDVKLEIDENNTLVIIAGNSFKEPEKPVMRQFNIGNYYRAFSLTDHMDKEKMTATLENGLLKIKIPKKEEARPKRIEIKA